MPRGPAMNLAALLTAALVAAACSTEVDEAADPAGVVALDRAPAPEGAQPASPSPEPPPTTSTTTATTTTTTATSTTTAATEPPPPARLVEHQEWRPFATVGPLTLLHPSSIVERVGFHESGHDGAQQMEPLDTTVAPVTLDTRDRGTGSRTAADIVVEPGVEIRAPVSGTITRAGTYVLYCDHSDDYAVIDPDDRPGWEVKVLHIDGVQVRAGDRVVAGQTVLAPRPTPLPFESQVDELRTADPAWPHVHIEVVDPSIPNTPKGPGC